MLKCIPDRNQTVDLTWNRKPDCSKPRFSETVHLQPWFLGNHKHLYQIKKKCAVKRALIFFSLYIKVFFFFESLSCFFEEKRVVWQAVISALAQKSKKIYLNYIYSFSHSHKSTVLKKNNMNASRPSDHPSVNKKKCSLSSHSLRYSCLIESIE